MEPNWQLARKRSTLTKRARIVQAIRAFFIEQDFLEVETPQRIPTNAPEFYIDAVPSGDWFLQTSPELAMKRLLAAGYGNIFQISHCWRDGERGKQHLPEYSMLEWYRPDSGYHSLMDDCENLLLHLTAHKNLIYQDHCIDLTPPWPRLTVAEAFERFASTSLEKALNNGEFDITISTQIEPNLPTDRPTLLIDYPASQASLAQFSKDNPKVAERVELYLGGMELANGFSELNDQQEQQRRFESEEDSRRAAGKPAYKEPTPFLNELATMPTAAGIAMGIDRLIMLLCDQNQIDNVVAFTPEVL